MRGLDLARDALARQHLKPGSAGKSAELGRREAKIAMIERFDRGAVRMLAKCCGEQVAALASTRAASATTMAG